MTIMEIFRSLEEFRGGQFDFFFGGGGGGGGVEDLVSARIFCRH